MKTFLTILLTAALSVVGTWIVLKPKGHDHHHDHAESSDRSVLYYQSAMHPWIKSDKPGRCTICGMELTPVYEGDSGSEGEADGELITLTPSQVQVLHPGSAVATMKNLTRTLTVAGTITHDNSRRAALSAYTDARIDKLYVNYTGATVEAGQPLAEIYSPTILQAAREYRQLTGELRAKAALRLRQLGLTQDQITALPNQPADALTVQILAPLGGTVVAQNIHLGEYATAGQTLFEIADFSTMWFLFDAYEQDLPWIHPGQDVTITTASLPGHELPGKVTFIDPNMDGLTRSTKVRVELENPTLPDGRRALLAGLYADAAITMESPAPVLTVPRSAVLQTGSQAVAYIVRGEGMYEQARLDLGLHGDSDYEILAGLSEGDHVVTQGNLLIDGQAEMNRAFGGAGESGDFGDGMATPLASGAAPSAEQKKAISDFLLTADAMSDALAADDLKKFNQVSEATMDQTDAFLKVAKELSAEHAIEKELWDQLDESRHFHGFDDLQEARSAFHDFSMAAVALIDALHHVLPLPEAQVYQCPMVDDALPDVPAKAFWIQVGTRQLANPYFGSEMLRCGSQVKS